MIQYFKNINGQTVEIDNPEQGVWVNFVPPFKDEEFEDLSNELDIPVEFLRDSLDMDERSRYEVDGDVKLLVIKTPTENNSFNDSDSYYITIPICIILTNQHIITVNSFDNVAIKKFLNTFQNRNPDKQNMMVLKVFEKVVKTFMEYLKEINHKRNQYEQALYKHNRSRDLLKLMRIQKSMVYFETALRSNELLMIKIERNNLLQLNEEEKSFLQDLIVDNSQAIEMANIYSNILSGTLNAFSTIINNNLHLTMRQLTAFVITVSLPAMLIACYGMKLDIFMLHSGLIFSLLLTLSIGISGGLSWMFMKKKWN